MNNKHCVHCGEIINEVELTNKTFNKHLKEFITNQINFCVCLRPSCPNFGVLAIPIEDLPKGGELLNTLYGK